MKYTEITYKWGKMKAIPKIGKMNRALESLKGIAEEVREILEEKRNWFDEKSHNWKESVQGNEWEKHMDSVESLLDEIDNLDPIEVQ